MEYKKFGDTIIVRMDPGDEVVEIVKKVCLAENVKLAMINALGAIDYFEVGAYSVPEKKYYKNEYKGEFEIVSLHGNITTLNGEFYSHMHMCAADKTGKTYGGHLNKAIISATCEMFITIINGKVDREKSDKTGLNIFKF